MRTGSCSKVKTDFWHLTGGYVIKIWSHLINRYDLLRSENGHNYDFSFGKNLSWIGKKIVIYDYLYCCRFSFRKICNHKLDFWGPYNNSGFKDCNTFNNFWFGNCNIYYLYRYESFTLCSQPVRFVILARWNVAIFWEAAHVYYVTWQAT